MYYLTWSDIVDLNEDILLVYDNLGSNDKVTESRYKHLTSVNSFYTCIG